MGIACCRLVIRGYCPLWRDVRVPRGKPTRPGRRRTSGQTGEHYTRTAAEGQSPVPFAVRSRANLILNSAFAGCVIA